MPPEPLTISIELRSMAPVTGAVVLTNAGDAEIRVWRMGNSWGDETLSFEMTTEDRVEQIVLKPQSYTRNVPSSIAIRPGGRHEIPFDFGDGTWEPPSVIGRLGVAGAQLAAVYEIRSSPEALTYGVWLGKLRSPWVLTGTSSAPKNL